jgi:hypothetical protein
MTVDVPGMRSLVEKVLAFLDEMLALGDAVQKATVSLRIEELLLVTEKREALFATGQKDLEALDAVLSGRLGPSRDQVLESRLAEINRRSVLLRMQDEESLRLLNQTRAFFRSVLEPVAQNGSYDALGRSGPRKALHSPVVMAKA